jgi:hypothetical protein
MKERGVRLQSTQSTGSGIHEAIWRDFTQLLTLPVLAFRVGTGILAVRADSKQPHRSRLT